MDERTTTAAMVVIGNLILSGKVADTNSAFLARELRRLGVRLARIAVIPDELGVIAEQVRAYAAGYDLVFTSGGVGPTHDDVTIDGIAAAFSVPVVEHPALRRAIEELVGERVTAAHLKMAQVPEGCELVAGDNAAFPTLLMRNVYVLPGIPEIFQAKMVALRERFHGRPYHLRQVLVAENETKIAEYLNATLAAFPELSLGSYPQLSHPEYRVRLTLESKDEAYVDDALADLLARMPEGYVVRIEY